MTPNPPTLYTTSMVSQPIHSYYPPPAHHGWTPLVPHSASSSSLTGAPSAQQQQPSALSQSTPTASSSTTTRPKVSRASASAPLLLAPDYTANPAGPASSTTTSFKCPQEGCDKVYKGKHARSIWRRHLQDKHGIPLSQQPRRTRWDNDANRPKSEEERRVRTLESKRRWAKKNRDEGRTFDGSQGGSEAGDFDEGDFEDWDDSMSPAPESQWQAPPPPPPPVAVRPSKSRTTSSKGKKAAAANAIVVASKQQSRAESDYEEEDRRRSSNAVAAAGDSRFPLVHRDANTGLRPPLDLTSGPQRYTPMYSAHPPLPYQHHGGDHAPYYGALAPQPSHHSAYPPPPQSPLRMPPAQHEPTFYSGSPVTTSLSTVAGRAALVPSPSFQRSYGQPLQHRGSQSGESKEDAAAVLLALKRASSPPSPAVSDRDRAANTSLDSNPETSFAFSSRGDDGAPSPDSELDDGATSEDIANLQKRALKRVPILPPVADNSSGDSHDLHFQGEKSSHQAPPTSQQMRSFDHSASLVKTPRQMAMRMAMESSPAFGHHEEGDFSDDDGHLSSSRRPSQRFGESPSTSLGKRSRGSQSSSSHAGMSSDVGGFNFTSPRRRTLSSGGSSSRLSGSASGEMLPPHPGSSSSASSFNLSTPAGPSRDTYGRFFPSSAGGPESTHNAYLPYHQQAHSRAPLGLSSPPGAPSYGMFSSPAHPGVSKQLGLTAQPGPGVLMSVAGTPGRGLDEERGEGGGGGGKFWIEGARLPGVREVEYGSGGAARRSL